jgi:hypothetical protein
MILDEGSPALRRRSGAPGPAERLGPVLANGSRRNQNAQLQPEFIGNPLFSPSYVLPYHPGDELAYVLGKWRPTAPRLPTPVQFECLAMPADESRWRHDGKRFFPIEKPGPEHQRQSCRICQAARPNLVILVVGQLLSQEQNFRC